MDRRQFLIQIDPSDIPSSEECPPGECQCEEGIQSILTGFKIKPMYQLAVLTALALLCALVFELIRDEFAIAAMMNKRVDSIACGAARTSDEKPFENDGNSCPHHAITGLSCCCDIKRKSAAPTFNEA